MFVTYAGVLPFYISPIISYYDYHEILVKFTEIKMISSLYAALIVCFLSGMQWQKIIDANIKGLFFFSPLIPLLLVLTYDNLFFSYYDYFIIFISLFFSLFIDLRLLKNSSEVWFRKLRINATILASFSLLL